MRMRWAALVAAGALAAARLLASGDAAGDEPLELAVVVGSRQQAAIALADLAPIFTTTTRELANGTAVSAFNMPPRSDERVLFDKVVLHLDPDESATFWIDRKIRGGSAPPRQIPEPALMLRVVAQVDGAIGYVPRARVDATVRVVAWVRNGKLTKP
jgi:hypothetical protein